MKKSYEHALRRRENGVHYKHDLGQHFIYDKAFLASLVEGTGVTPNDGVLEIGPGAGTLTQCLCEAAGRVIAVEVDHDILPFLRTATEAYDNLTIVEGDIRSLDIRTLCEPLGAGFDVIANIPYSITTPIFELLWTSGLPIRQISVMVQKEVAMKLMALPGDEAYGLMSVKCRYYCEPHLLAEAGAERFTPPPKVDSAFVRLDMRTPSIPADNERLLFQLLKAGFGLRRKTLQNALKGVAKTEPLQDAFRAIGLEANVRGEALSVEEWIRLANAYSQAVGGTNG